MDDKKLGLILMIASLGFGAIYAISFLVWASSLSKTFGYAAWSWWVIALPAVVIVTFTVFFSAWIGWVMFTASKSKREELLGKG